MNNLGADTLRDQDQCLSDLSVPVPRSPTPTGGSDREVLLLLQRPDHLNRTAP